MDIEELIKKIESTREKVANDIHSDEGLLRLQEVAAQYNGEDRLIWSDELLKEVQARPKKTLFKTNISLLDDLIGGFREQQLITISASSKHGKTTFGMFLTGSMEELNPVVIPLEQSNEELVEQYHENGYPLPKFLSPRKLAAKVDVDWIEQRVIEGIAKYDTKFVLIDHLGYIDNLGPGGVHRRENLAYRIGEVMRSLKNIAKRWNVVIVLLAQISQKDEGNPPTLEDLKGSSDILQESDMVIMLWRKNTQKGKVRVYEDKTMVSVMANRRTGRNGSIGLLFDTGSGRYGEDNEWVRAMMEMAEQEVAVDDAFNA